MDDYSISYEIRWADLDATADLRYRFFAQPNFPPGVFQQLGIGAVYTALTANFLREVRLGETLTVTYLLAGLSPQGTRWKVQHDILKSTGKVDPTQRSSYGLSAVQVESIKWRKPSAYSTLTRNGTRTQSGRNFQRPGLGGWQRQKYPPRPEGPNARNAASH